MSIRNKRMDRRFRVMEKHRAVELREALVESLLDSFRAGRLIPMGATAATVIRWPPPAGER